MAGASRGRRGTILHPPSFRVAGVALMALGGALGSGLGAPWSRVTLRHFAWQAWHKLTSTIVSAWQAWHKLTSTFVSRGRRGTNSHPTFASRGRRGTISHPQAFCVAGVALMAVGGALGSGLGAPWSRRDTAPFCVAGLAQTHIHPLVSRGSVVQTHSHLRFAWQAWHSWQWVACLGLVWARPGRA